MRIQFINGNSMLLWIAILLIIGFITHNFPPDVSMIPIVTFIFWILVGSGITDLVVDKDWEGLIKFIIFLLIILFIIFNYSN